MKCRFSMLILFLVAAMACQTGDGDLSICGDGVDLTVDGLDYCVYESGVVIETGFRCPPERPYEYPKDDLIFCSDQPDLTDDDLDEARQEYESSRQGDPQPDIGLDFDFDTDAGGDGSAISDTGMEDSADLDDATGSCDDRLVPVARGRVLGTEGDWTSTVNATPLDTIELDGTGSNAPNGTISAYRWNLMRRPSGSLVELAPNAETATPSLWLDLAGQYAIELTVWDDEGNPSCLSDEVIIQALPCCDGGVHVQLVWTTDETDMDLHLLHPNGTAWNETPWDCFFQNRDPDWGTSGTDDDPVLDIDDTDGLGPENINLSFLEGSAYAPLTYRVGVLYFSDYGGGATVPTVRIYLGGILQLEAEGPEMEEGEFWEPAWITGPLGDIQRGDLFSSTLPSGILPCSADTECPPDSYCSESNTCIRGCRTDPDNCPGMLTCDPVHRECG